MKDRYVDIHVELFFAEESQTALADPFVVERNMANERPVKREGIQLLS